MGPGLQGFSPSGLLGQMQGAHYGPMMQVCRIGTFEIMSIRCNWSSMLMIFHDQLYEKKV